MKPLRTRLQEARQRLGIPWEILERDYLLSWILAGISQHPLLRDTLVFKGGTALKKCYFGDYRFSEDLDFSGVEGVPTGDAMEDSVRVACDTAEKLVNEYAAVDIVCERYTEKLRAILQHVQKLEERGWSRSRARDYYDLWRVLGKYKEQMNLSGFASLVHEKCALREVDFNGPEDFFQESLLAYIEETWNQWLGQLVPQPPDFKTVIDDLRPQVEALVS